MRVYEFAKQNGVTSKEILGLLEKAEIKLASHMSVIPKEGLLYLDKFFKKSKKSESQKKVTAKVIEKNKTTANKIKPEVKASVAAQQIAKKPVDSKPVEKKQSATSKPVAARRTSGVVHTASKKAPAKFSFKSRSKRKFRKPAPVPVVPEEITHIIIEGDMPLFEAAAMMGKNSSELILPLLKRGMACNRNHVLAVDIIAALAEEFGIASDVELKDLSGATKSVEKATSGENRWPIVVVMGHVDHGKTTLLDYLRKMNTAIREKGGITQHLGAYEVDCPHGKIVFLDTPGHEAFTSIRSRGTSVTDIAILVIAADDGIKPQTIEAINIAKEAGVPIIVAINKMDKLPGDSDAAIQTIKRQLAEHSLVVEDWGGDIVCVPISAKTGNGVEELIEMVVLQSQMMDLRAEPEAPAKAFILESKQEKGHGPVATVVCVDGTIKQGDFFVCGNGTGKVRLLINSFGEKVNQAGPSTPVKVVGFDSFAGIGDWLNVVSSAEYLKAKSSKKGYVVPAHEQISRTISSVNLESKDQINLIIKTDTRGSKEAIEGSIFKIAKKAKKGFKPLYIVQSGIGDITEGDIEMADATGSMIIGLHVKTERNATTLAKNKGINIKHFDIIYHLVEYIEETLEKTKTVEITWKKVGQLAVTKVFNIKKIGVIAGCSVQEGVISRDNKVVGKRGGKIIGEGMISSLQREGKVVKEVHAGYECGFICDQFSDWQEGDIVETFAKVTESSEKK